MDWFPLFFSLLGEPAQQVNISITYFWLLSNLQDSS